MRRLALVTLLIASTAESAPCKLDRARYPEGAFGEALVCNGTHLEDIWVRSERGRITGVYWSEYQGLHKKRTIHLTTTGRATFIVEDSSVRGGFFAQTRGTSHYLFPRGGRMTIDEDPDDLHVRIHDAAGHTWELAGMPASDTAVSYTVVAIDGAKQRAAPISFDYRGIVGVDLGGTHYLEHHEPSMTGLADRRSREYKATRSIFHDAAGHACPIANGELYVPSPADPTDKSDDVFKFDDDELGEFLATACPKLDFTADSRRRDRAR